MAGITLEKEKRLYRSGMPISALHLITQGKVAAEYPGGSYVLKKGDVIGVGELCSELHFLGYTTLEETSLLNFSANTIESLDKFLEKNLDLTRLFLRSLFKQITILLGQCSLSEMSCIELYQNLMEDYHLYHELSDHYRIPSHPLEGIEEVTAYLVEDSDPWLNGYYQGLKSFYAGEGARMLAELPGISLGMLKKGCLDFRKAYSILDEQFQYRCQVMPYYFRPSGGDLFDMCTALYHSLGQTNEDAGRLYQKIDRMIHTLENAYSLDQDAVALRVGNFRSSTAQPISPEAPSRDALAKQEAEAANARCAIAGSLNAILDFAQMDPEKSKTFRNHVASYKALGDKNAMEDSVNRLRRQLTEEFHDLYAAVCKRALISSQISAPVKLFLYFGVVDEELAGLQNCETLYRLAQTMEDSSQSGFYPFYHWLQAVFDGEKEPSRNEFDEDYNVYLNKQKAMGNITAAQASLMQNDPMFKIDFELENMFRQSNKVTFGRITTYCPLFAAENVLKDLDDSYVTLAKINSAIETVRTVDYSAYYRESLDLEHMDTMGKETVHMEFLPDVILMPNAGTRGVMWQEIEGKKRNSPSRMVFSIFHLEDITTSLIRLTGEFRWEMCKRIQGARWNDVTERSLTSEYFDYVQFYRKNHELSAEAKERLHTSLQRARNSFKEMFVRDYILWVLFEGNNSPRLNKVARRILLTYCPFSAELSVSMEQNPLFSELLSRQKTLKSQRLHHLNMICQKLRNANTPIPASLEAEIAYTRGQREKKKP